MSIYDENAYEQCLKELFQDVDRDFHSPLFKEIIAGNDCLVIPQAIFEAVLSK